MWNGEVRLRLPFIHRLQVRLSRINDCFMKELAASIAKVNVRCDEIEVAIATDRTAVQRTIEAAVEGLSSQLEEFKARYNVGETERDRKEEEARKLQEENFVKMKMLFETERVLFRFYSDRLVFRKIEKIH